MDTPLRLLWSPLLLLVAACGGTGHGTPPPADLSGSWILTLVHDGVDDDPRHMTLLQTGSDVTATLTCDDSVPPGHGTYVGGVLSLAFDLGGGTSFTLAATAAGTTLYGTYVAPDGGGDLRLQSTSLTLDCSRACDPVSPIRFVSTDFTELAKIEEISLLRSAAGHDYSDACESCRSMKHYFAPSAAHRVNGDVQIRSPVDGTVVSVTEEGHGASVGLENKQVRIRSTAHPEYTFVLFHVDLGSAAIAAGKVLAAGAPIGTARLVYPDLNEVAHDFDIAVHLHTLYGPRFVSYFDVMTDALFSEYQARGVGTRADLILSRAARDADPLTCGTDESFTTTGSLPNWFVLSP